jgi:hypothetical protein
MRPDFTRSEEEEKMIEGKKEKAAEELAEKKRCETQEPAADIHARQKERVEKAIAQLPPPTLLMRTDGGYIPHCSPGTKHHRGKPKPATEEAAGWGAVIWHRVVHAEGIHVDERPATKDFGRACEGIPGRTWRLLYRAMQAGFLMCCDCVTTRRPREEKSERRRDETPTRTTSGGEDRVR